MKTNKQGNSPRNENDVCFNAEPVQDSSNRAGLTSQIISFPGPDKHMVPFLKTLQAETTKKYLVGLQKMNLNLPITKRKMQDSAIQA